MKAPRWLKEPLVHFLAAGGLLFAASLALKGGDDEARTIRIGRDDLLVFMQGRAQVYDETTFQKLLDRMKPEERSALVRDTAIQQALYREGKALGLAEADPLIRQRVVQQMRLLLMEEAAAGLSLSDAEVKAFHARNRKDYALAPTVTFTHAFVPGAASGGQAAKLVSELRKRQVPFDRAGEYGARFLYQVNYVDVGAALVASHFGKGFADAVLTVPTGQWQGPIQSEHGWHAVLISRRSAMREPTLAEVLPTVREDALAEARQRAADRALDGMLARYTIVAADGLEK
jgi:hypothetical protein